MLAAWRNLRYAKGVDAQIAPLNFEYGEST